MTTASQREPDAATRAAVEALVHGHGLAATTAALRFELIAGGVNAEIWRVDAGDITLCAKQCRERPAVAAGAYAPLACGRNEVAWHRAVASMLPDHVPTILAEDPARDLFIMPWYPPREWRPWKRQLLEGRTDASAVQAIAGGLARIHAASDQDPALAAHLAERFDTWACFHALRAAPFFEAVAEAHPDLTEALDARVAALRTAPPALVHGDVSPKNILLASQERWILLDAQCAWWGDPAFDVAVMLCHLFLKGAAVRERGGAFVTLAETFLHTYRDSRASDDSELERRVARLLPALLLARIDGRSPVEYLSTHMRARIRSFARTQLRVAPDDVERLGKRWVRTIGDIDD